MVRVIIYFFYYGLLLVVILVFYMTRNKRKTLSYILLCKLKDNILQQYYCGEMVSLFLECLKNGYKTKQCLELLRGLISKPIVSFLAFHLDESLLAGDSLKDATSQNYYDSLLSGYIKIASLTNNFEQYLENYVFLNQKKIKDKIKRYTIILQGSVYGLIGVVIIFVYQIMLMPMQAIINF